MGRQFGVYIIGDDIKQLNSIIQDNNAWIIYTDGTQIQEDDIYILGDEALRRNKYPYGNFYLVNEESQLRFKYYEKLGIQKFDRWNSIGYLEISFCSTEKGISMPGRIYYRTEIYNDEGWVKQPEEYTALFNRLKKQISKAFIKGSSAGISFYMGENCHEEYLKGNFKPEWWEEPSTNTNTVIDDKTAKSETSVVPADNVSNESDDIAGWLHEYTENDNLEIKPVTCRSCGSGTFEIIADQDEGAVQVKCTNCGEEKFLLDSEEIWEETEPTQMVCPECGEGIEFNVRVGFSRREEGGDVDWVYIGSRCTKCGAISSFLDWEIDYGPTAEMEQNL